MTNSYSIRQLIIYRIEAYVHELEFYDPPSVDKYNKLKYDSLSDEQLLREFELLVYFHQSRKNQSKV